MAWWKFWDRKSFSLPDANRQMGRAGYPIWSDWATEKAVKQGYQASTWVYACIEQRSKALASVPWLAQQRVGKEWEDRPDSPLQLLINRPNPDMSLQMLMRHTVQHIDLAGASYWTKVRAGNGRMARELWPQNPAEIQIIPGRERLVEGFQFTGTGRRVPMEDMVYLRLPSPASFIEGHASIRSAGRATDIDREAEEFQWNALQNRGVTDIAIKVDKDTTPEQLAMIRELWQQNYSGPTNARKTPITTAEIQQLGQTAAEMDYVESRKFIRESICSAFGVPPVMVGILENATLANIETARKIFWLDTIVPLLSDIEHQLTLMLAADFGPEWRLTYDLTGIEALQENYKHKAEAAAILRGMGVPLNEINRRLDLGLSDGLPAGDIGFMSAGMIPVTGELPEATEEPEARGLDSELLQRLAYGSH